MCVILSASPDWWIAATDRLRRSHGSHRCQPLPAPSIRPMSVTRTRPLGRSIQPSQLCEEFRICLDRFRPMSDALTVGTAPMSMLFDCASAWCICQDKIGRQMQFPLASSANPGAVSTASSSTSKANRLGFQKVFAIPRRSGSSWLFFNKFRTSRFYR